MAYDTSVTLQELRACERAYMELFGINEVDVNTIINDIENDYITFNYSYIRYGGYYVWYYNGDTDDEILVDVNTLEVITDRDYIKYLMKFNTED